MKIVYVTGCLGLIGSHITRLCLERNWYVIGVDACTNVANTSLLCDFNKHSNFKFIKSDINDLETLYDCDYIINTAAETHVANSLVDSSKFLKSNINGVEKKINPSGRHDPCVLPRAIPIIDAMTALVIMDHYLLSKTC